jgi:hypothetical protein
LLVSDVQAALTYVASAMALIGSVPGHVPSALPC